MTPCRDDDIHCLPPFIDYPTVQFVLSQCHMSFMAKNQLCKPAQPRPTASPLGEALRPVVGIGMKKVLPGPLADTMLLVPHPIF